MSEWIVNLAPFTRIDRDHPWFHFIEIRDEDDRLLSGLVVAYLDKSEAIIRKGFINPDTGTADYYYPKVSQVTIRARPEYEGLWEQFTFYLGNLIADGNALESQAIAVWATSPTLNDTTPKESP